jgi:hypothetical protein
MFGHEKMVAQLLQGIKRLRELNRHHQGILNGL